MRPLAITSAAAVVGSLGTKPDSDWYRSIERPSWEPAGIAVLNGLNVALIR